MCGLGKPWQRLLRASGQHIGHGILPMVPSRARSTGTDDRDPDQPGFLGRLRDEANRRPDTYRVGTGDAVQSVCRGHYLSMDNDAIDRS
jgi:hypothetical protein